MSMPEPEVNEQEGTVVPANGEEAVEAVPKAMLSPQDALEKIRHGETLHDVRVEGLCFRGEFSLPVKMWNVVLIRPQFHGAVFQGEVVFNRCTLDRPSFHRKNEFTGNLVLSESTLVQAHLTGITGRLASEEHGDHAQAMHEYAYLKRAFGSLHRYDQEDWAYYRFKVNQRRCCHRSWWRPWTKLLQFLDWLLLDHGCGYCTNPFRAVRAALFIMLGFGLIYMAGIVAFSRKVIR
jgi:hypothetical protein